LKIKIDIEDHAWAWPVPNLILQPVVENAIKHGLSKTEGEVVLSIAGRLDDNVLVIEVTDNGEGLHGSFFREGIGISNLRRRLEYQYGSNDLFLIDFNKLSKGCFVTIRFPHNELL
jgi:two-component system, LytTR family, sensor kinase